MPRRFLAAAAPVVFLFALYYHGLNTFFFQDDFAWLSLLRQTWNFHDFLHSMFAPMAQGTVRPLSERGFYMLLQTVFGMDAYPFHMVVFLTMSASLLLSGWLALRLTGSALAAFLTPLFWAGNASLVTVMTWNSSYNEVLCSLFLLGALALFIRFVETGRRSFWWAQFLVFLVGFGALEINIVYPALAAAWVVFLAPPQNRRRLLLCLAPLAVTSVVYFILHRVVAPLPTSGPYQLHIGPGMVKTLAYYWQWTVLPNQWFAFGHSRRLAVFIIASGSLGMAAMLWAGWRRKAGVIAFCIAWYLIALVPILPLSAHRTDYYLTIPLFGFALAAAVGFAWAWSKGLAWTALAAVPVLVYFGAMIPIAHAQTLWWEARAENVRVLVFGVRAAKQAHPNRALVLDGITSYLYDDAVGQSAFYPLGIDDVYLTPGSELNIHPGGEMDDIRRLVLEPAVMYHALTHDQVVIYSVAGDHLRNITGVYEQTTAGRLSPQKQADRLPGFVDIGNPLYSWLLGPSWSKSEFGTRWMPDQAAVRLGIPENGNKLQLEGFLPLEQLRGGQRHLKVSVAGVPLGETQINDPESNFRRLFSLPADFKGRPAVDVTIRVDPVVRVDGELRGLIFGKISVVP